MDRKGWVAYYAENNSIRWVKVQPMDVKRKCEHIFFRRRRPLAGWKSVCAKCGMSSR